MGCGTSSDTVSSSTNQEGKSNQTNDPSVRETRPPAATRAPRPDIDDINSPAKWEMEALEAHNRFRALHGVPPLVLKPDISQKAKIYAEYLAKNNLFEHSQDRDGLGENLYTMSSSESLKNVPLGKNATESWYEEIHQYDFDNPEFSQQCGHFTQVVWKNTTAFGIGVGFGDDGRRAVVVARYSPPGNYLGQFPENVPQPI